MKKIKEKRDSGITLVALVVTIVVLLILAGVSLNLVLSDNGIIAKAKDAKEKTEQDQLNTEQALENLDDWMEKQLGSETGGGNPNLPEISETESYVGYYADIDGNGTVDGIIYADLAIGGEGQWTDVDGNYTIPVIEEGLKSYCISQEIYTDGPFEPKGVLTPTGTGKDRFYVMALSDIDANTHYWYYSAGSGTMSDYSTYTSTAFGKGKENTLKMLDKWKDQGETKNYAPYYGAQDSNDMWGLIQTQVNAGWFVPSKAEWSAFAEELGITSSDYANFGLSDWYWSSSQSYAYGAYYAGFRAGCISNDDVPSGTFVRLSATF